MKQLSLVLYIVIVLTTSGCINHKIKSDLEIGNNLNTLGVYYIDHLDNEPEQKVSRRDFVNAVQSLKYAVYLREKNLGALHSFTLASKNNLATLYAITHYFRKSDEILNEIISDLSKKSYLTRDDQYRIAKTYDSKGFLYGKMKNYKAAIFWYKKAICYYEKYIPNHDYLPFTFTELGKTYLHSNNLNQAEANLKQAVILYNLKHKKCPGYTEKYIESIRDTYNHLIQVLTKLHRNKEARKFEIQFA